jgi:hypothetical protein
LAAPLAEADIDHSNIRVAAPVAMSLLFRLAVRGAGRRSPFRFVLRCINQTSFRWLLLVLWTRQMRFGARRLRLERFLSLDAGWCPEFLRVSSVF